jgi:hypothetical protein
MNALVFLALTVCGLTFCLSSTCCFGQEDEYLNVNNVEDRVKREFRLTQQDVRYLHPLIKSENEKILVTYKHFSEQDSENFLGLWQNIRAGRKEFETGLGISFSARQKKALRSARSEIESRILNMWMEDFLNTLTQTLELDKLQMSFVAGVFQIETEKRHQLIVLEAKQRADLSRAWQELTDKRDSSLEMILDPQQFREYRLLGRTVDRLFAMNGSLELKCSCC